MGMAASQARLLCLTARIHDVEYQAQAIQNAKIQLATQSDQAYQKYNEALDATTLTLRKIDPSSGSESLIAANFNNLCSKNKAVAANGKDYALFDYRNRLIVEDDIADVYDDFSGDSAYAFAMFMINGNAIGNVEDGSASVKIQEAELNAINNTDSDSTTRKIYDQIVALLNEVKPNFSEEGGSSIYDGENLIETYADSKGLNKKELLNEYNTLMAQLRNKLYQSSAEEVYNYATDQDDYELNMDDFNYYVNIYNQIKAAGGCVSIDEYRGNIANADVANDSDWLQAMVKCGKITIATVDYNSKTREASFNSTSTSSDSIVSETATTDIDKKALAKAEAEYEHALKNINKKDKEYDLSLSKLDSERNALKTEYESVKKVVEENIDRTFGIFS